MTPRSKPIVFFGTEDFSAGFLDALCDGGYDVRLVVTKPDAKKGRGHKLSAPLVKVRAQARNIPVIQPDKLSDIRGAVGAIGDDAAGILVSYGKIIPQSIIDLFDPGIINVHPSLLPRYRGPSPIESAILNGESETGVSIMQLSKEMDAGPVYSQIRTSLDGTETRAELYQMLGALGVDELLRVLPDIMSGALQPSPQDDSHATYCSLLSKADGTLRPDGLTAQQAERQIRAYQGFPKSRLTFGGMTIIVTKAHVSDERRTPLDLKCKDGRFLSVDELIAPSGKAMTAGDFLRGYRV